MTSERSLLNNDNSNSPNQEDLVDATFSSTVESIRRSHFCIFGHVNLTATYSTAIVVTHSVCISDAPSYILDQIPTSVKLLNATVSIIYGTNGLLSLCSSRPTFLYRHPLDSHTQDVMSLTVDCCDEINQIREIDVDYHQPSCRPRANSHSITSVITAVEFQYETSTLATGDNEGMVCLWRIDMNIEDMSSVMLAIAFPEPQMISRPLKLSHSLSGIKNIVISPSGQQLIVSLRDRLLLIALNRRAKNLFVRSILDILTDRSIIYHCAFRPDSIRIWRLLDLSPDQSAPGHQ